MRSSRLSGEDPSPIPKNLLNEVTDGESPPPQMGGEGRGRAEPGPDKRRGRERKEGRRKRKKESRAREMAQSLKCLAQKPENLGSDSCTHRKKAGLNSVHPVLPRWGGRERRVSSDLVANHYS